MNRDSARDAHAIQEGACNPRAIARAIVRAVDEAADQGGSRAPGQSPAVRQMIHQLAWILWGTDPYDQAIFAGCKWTQDHKACEELAKAPAREQVAVAA